MRQLNIAHDKLLPSSLLELIFVQANAEIEATAGIDKHNKKAKLNRAEWLECIVRFAMEKYGSSTRDLDDAIEVLLQKDILPNLPPGASQNANLFRKTYCYIEQTDAVLRRHKETLKSLYDEYADLATSKGKAKDGDEDLGDGKLMSIGEDRPHDEHGPPHDEHGQRLLLPHHRPAPTPHPKYNLHSLLTPPLNPPPPPVPAPHPHPHRHPHIGEWLYLLSHLELIESKHLSIMDAKFLFVWSRMRSVPDHSRRSHVRYRHLMFEDFLEAFVRLACIVALPNDEEIEVSGADDAGDYLISFEASSRTEFTRFVEQSRGHWSKEPRQSVWRCVEHLVAFITQLIEENTSHIGNAKDRRVSISEAATFANRRQLGRQLTKSGKSSKSSRELIESLHAVKDRLVTSLSKVAVFESLTEQQLEELASIMAEAPFKAGDYVFDQGDEGTAFYVILAGTVDVIRDEDTDDERVLTSLSDGACFGERALLQSEPRFATVRATSKLRTMTITRDRFEKQFGPLGEIVKNLHY